MAVSWSVIEPSKARSRIIRLIPTWIAFVLVMVLGPRMEGPRVVCGHELRSRGGGPGLTNLGFVLLVVVPVAVYLIAGVIERWWQRRSAKTWP